MEGCAALGKLLEPADCVANVLPVIVSFSQVGLLFNHLLFSGRSSQIILTWLVLSVIRQQQCLTHGVLNNVVRIHWSHTRVVRLRLFLLKWWARSIFGCLLSQFSLDYLRQLPSECFLERGCARSVYIGFPLRFKAVYTVFRRQMFET